jgi:hypothetical protein
MSHQQPEQVTGDAPKVFAVERCPVTGAASEVCFLSLCPTQPPKPMESFSPKLYALDHSSPTYYALNRAVLETDRSVASCQLRRTTAWSLTVVKAAAIVLNPISARSMGKFSHTRGPWKRPADFVVRSARLDNRRCLEPTNLCNAGPILRRRHEPGVGRKSPSGL